MDIVERLRRYRPTYGWPEERSVIVEPTMNHVAADEIERLRKENAELRKFTDWQPIETAPKDGSCVLAWFDEAKHHFLLYWLNDAWRFKSTHIKPITDPSHWMPLPEPPK